VSPACGERVLFPRGARRRPMTCRRPRPESPPSDRRLLRQPPDLHTAQVLPDEPCALLSRLPSAEHVRSPTTSDLPRCSASYSIWFFRIAVLSFPILVVSAIAVPCWLVFRLYRHRTRRHPLSFAREVLLLAFVVVIAEGAGGIELRPNLASLTCSPAILPKGSDRGFCVRNARGNFLLFFPLGILIPLVWRRLGFWTGIQIAIASSFGIELIQYLSSAWGSYRAADINDIVLNVLGAGLDLALVFLLRSLRGTLSRFRPPEPAAGDPWPDIVSFVWSARPGTPDAFL
jgi:hypothetical protein